MAETLNPQMFEEPPDEKPVFHAAATQKFRETVNEVLLAHPEIRSALVIMDYAGGLNDQAIPKALWLGKNGRVNNPAAIFGMLQNMFSAMGTVVSAAMAVEQALKKTTTAMIAEVNQLEKNLDTAKQAAAAAQDATGHEITAAEATATKHWPEYIAHAKNSNNIYTAYEGGRTGGLLRVEETSRHARDLIDYAGYEFFKYGETSDSDYTNGFTYYRRRNSGNPSKPAKD